MIKNLTLITLFIIFSCGKPPAEKMIPNLQGYWEIQKAISSAGIEKEFKYSQNIEYFEIKDSTGFRKKVQPRLDGSFLISEDLEPFTITVENDSLRIFYKNTWDSWKETVVKATDNELMIVNENGNQYFYKRFQKIDIVNGETNQ